MSYDEDLDFFRYRARTHSGIGIASFAIALACAFFEFVLVLSAGVLEATTPGGIDENSPLVVVVGLCLLGGLGVDLFAIGLGVAGLFQENRKKRFAVLGLVLGSLVMFGVLLVLVVGLLAG